MSTDNYTSLASSALSSAASVASQMYAGSQARAATYDEYIYQHMLNQEQNLFNEKMYDKNNEYNDPANQIARFINAGINPGSAVQSVTGNHYNSSQAQASSSPGVSANYGQVAAQTSQGVINAFSSLLQNELLQKQAENISEQTKGIQIENSTKPEYLATQIADMKSNIDKKSAEISSIVNDIKWKDNINVAEANKIAMEIKKMQSEIDQASINLKISSYNAKTDRDRQLSQAALNQSQLEINKLQLSLIHKTGIKLDRECELLLEQANEAHARYLLYGKESDLKDEQIKYERFLNQIRDYNGVDWYADKEKLDYILPILIPWY